LWLGLAAEKYLVNTRHLLQTNNQLTKGFQMITQAELKEIFDYVDGNLVYRYSPRKNKKTGDIAGSIDSKGYLIVSVKGSRYKAHRLIWLWHYGEFPKHDIDHINGIRNDNHIENLRDVSRSVNMQNQKKGNVDNKSGLLGVHWNKDRDKWNSIIYINGKRKYLGLFNCKNKAYEAYIKAKRQFHEGNTL
jgi:hypothetical protein